MQRFTRRVFTQIAARSTHQALISAGNKMNYLTKVQPMIGRSFKATYKQYRAFSSLPEHIKLEMPNLSPTMEKVSTPNHH